MVNKWFLIAAGSLLLAGCAADDAPPEPPPGKVRVEVKHRSGDVPASARRESASSRRARKNEPPEPAPSPNRAAMQRVISGQGGPMLQSGARRELPVGLEGELNDVERSYVRGVRERNARTEQAAEQQVFGGFIPGRK